MEISSLIFELRIVAKVGGWKEFCCNKKDFGSSFRILKYVNLDEKIVSPNPTEICA